ncbi:MAG: hypothetical protein GY826_04285 [Fuerstiella sp.]|nr:hypothetical protein [Fuerstiella sp.]
MMCCPKLQTVALIAATMLSGCNMSERQEVLEVRLREHESTIRDLQSQIRKAEQTLAEQDHELSVERNRISRDTESASADDVSPASGVRQVAFNPEVEAAWGSVSSIGIHRLTSGMIQGEEETDRSINVVVQSLDSDGDPVKTAGAMTLAVSVVADDGTMHQIAQNSYSMTECRRFWTRSFVAPGFHVQIPLNPDSEPALSTGDRILITVTLDLGHDRSFSTSELLDVSS